METIQKISEKSNIINMEKSSLEKMSKSELIDLLLEQISNKRPIPAPRKSVKTMAQKYEENVSSSPTYFIKPIPKPRTQKSLDAYIPSKLSQSISQMQQALEGYTKSFNIDLRDNKDPLVQLQKSRKDIEYLFNNQLKIFKGFKYVETLQVKFVKFSNGQKTEKNGFFNSKADLILNNTDIQASLQISKQHILNIISQWVSEGSGWTVESIESHHLNIANYSPLKGSSYIDLPTEIKNPKSLINIKNEDNECFRWCHIRHLNPQNKNPQRIKKIDKNLIKQLDYSNIEFPVTVKQINKIEKQNNIRINLFGYEEKQKFPLYISQEKYHEHMELLLINKDKKNHYVLIKNFNKFMFDQTKHKCKKYFCMYCLQCFSRKDVLDEHVKNCISINGKQAIKMPEKGQHVNFRNYHKQIPAPFVIYADFEAITEKVHGCLPNNEKSYTEAYQKHIDCGYGYKLVCHYDDEFSKPVQVFRGENAVHNFMEKMLEEVEWCKSITKKHFNKPLVMTEENELDFKSTNHCHICKNQYSEEDIRVRDHCHITGNYRGSAHQDCNLKLRLSPNGLSWDAMLKMTKIKLELVTDIDMYQFIEKGLRGGTSYIANRFSEANNKYMENYNENLPSKYIMYLDANNLYGWAMSQYLPTGNFKWLTKEQINKTNLAKYTAEHDEGLLLEVDLDYPKELHDLHNDYPLAPEKLKVNKNMLSEYCKKIAGKFNISSGQVHKLITTLGKKEKYVLHYRNLQLYLSLGLKLKKVHRVLQFNQSPWLKKYIDFNTNKRTFSKNDFEKNFFKLMNNSVFGKTMENLRKRVDVRLVTNKEKFLKLSSKPSYVSAKIFNENLVAVHKIKETLLMNRPSYVGACILDLSKAFMYDFHYNYIKCKYGDKAKLLFTDTDSLTYEIETSDAYADFFDDKEIFDNSDYNKKSPFYFGENKKVIGKFKDEAAGIPVTEFVGLRSKMYSYTLDNKQSKRTAKGIKKNIIQNNLSHGNYKKVLLSEEQIHHSMKTIRSMKHQLASFELNKISLSCFDDKRYIHKNGITSYAYGHYKILKV